MTHTRRSTVRRLGAAWTLLQYVICGLTLTAHIAFADHHCHTHCAADHVPATAGAVAEDCHFHHHAVEEHHEEAVDKPGSAKTSLGATTASCVATAPDAPAVTPDTTPVAIPRDVSGAPPPARAPPTR